MSGPSGVGLVLLAGYLLGALPFGYLVGRLVGGADLREHGSRRTGSTNVLRTVGWSAAGVVLLLDVTKGAAAVLLARVAFEPASPDSGEWLAAAAGLAAVVGHIWPVFIGFRGGRGVATAGGALLGLVPPAVPVIAVVLVVVTWLWRFVSLGSISAALAAPVVVGVLLAADLARPPHLAFASATALLLVLAHADNIARLRAGTERRLGHREAR